MSVSIVPDSQRIRVELDARFRFQRVEVASLDPDLRRSQSLAAAFDEAFSDAISRQVESTSDRSTRGARVAGERPRPAGPVLRTRPPLPDVAGREPRWDLINQGLGAHAPAGDLQALGRSRNDCVHISLDPASSRGRLVDIDQGWLSQTTVPAVTSAINEAFEDAYGKRNLR